MTCMTIVNSQPEVCEIILSTNLIKSLFSELFRRKKNDKYHLSIEIDIEQLLANDHEKMDLKIHSLDV